MSLDQLEARDFRCIRAASLDPHSETNLIVGENGSGKTTLLEALHVLGTGRSFRVRDLSPLVRRGAEQFELCARTSQPRQVIEARAGSGGLQLRINEQGLRGTADLAFALPVQALHPEMHALIDGPPEGRRRFLDWGAFHVKQTYLQEWRRYHRALRQRNTALKEGLPPRELDGWDAELIRAGTIVDRDREECVRLIAERFAQISGSLLAPPSRLRYQRGWSEDQTLEDAIRASAGRDRLLKSTQVGPHRADLDITLAAAPARYSASRGQQKMLALSLGLAQAQIIASATTRQLLLLLDDPVAEVDGEGAARLATEVARVPAQRFVTGLRRDSYPCDVNRVFHVKQGELTQVI